MNLCVTFTFYYYDQASWASQYIYVVFVSLFRFSLVLIFIAILVFIPHSQALENQYSDLNGKFR